MPNNNEQIVVKPSKWKSFKDTYFLTGSIDIPFLGLTIALLTIGLIMLFSASYPYAYSSNPFCEYPSPVCSRRTCCNAFDVKNKL